MIKAENRYVMRHDDCGVIEHQNFIRLNVSVT